MVRQIRIAPLRAEELFLLEDFEEFEQAARRLTRTIEIAQRRLIGRGFDCDRVFQECALSNLGSGEDARTAGIAVPERAGRAAQHHADNALDHGVLHYLGFACEMTTGDVAGLVRHHPDKLIWTLRLLDGAAV